MLSSLTCGKCWAMSADLAYVDVYSEPSRMTMTLLLEKDAFEAACPLGVVLRQQLCISSPLVLAD